MQAEHGVHEQLEHKWGLEQSEHSVLWVSACTQGCATDEASGLGVSIYTALVKAYTAPKKRRVLCERVSPLQPLW